MSMSRARSRYVTICQQVLVTAVVVAVGLSAAGVMTLKIVSPESQRPGDLNASSLAPAIKVTEGYAATKVVTPKVREVKIAPVALKTPAKAPAKTPATPRATTKKTAPAKTLAAMSKPEAVHGYGTVGVTWKSGEDLAEDAISIQIRTKKNGTWSGWQTAQYHDEHGPDADTAEGERATRPGTDAIVVGDVDEVQMRAETLTGKAPDDLELAVIDPGATPVVKQPAAIDTADLPASDRDATSSAPIESTAGMEGSDGTATHGDGAAVSSGSTDSDISLAAMKTAPKPTIYSRAQWGANEKMRDASSLRYGTVKTGFIHHTVNANNYTAEQVPALIRGIYAYHTQSRGWSDIGYNYLVDRFGRIWEGRYGGVDRAVVGAHTLGYNEYAFAMSAIGNYDIAQPPQAVLDAYAKLFAWKLSLYNIKADATNLWVKDRYLNAINGHRDVGQTACPGRYLYAKIPSIRIAAAAIQEKAQGPSDPVNETPVAAPKGLLVPTTKPLAATPQKTVSKVLRSNVAGSSWPDALVQSASGVISVLPTEGQLGYGTRIVSAGNWSAFSLIAAVGDMTGDGRSDVIAVNRKSGLARVFPGDGKGKVSRTGVAPTTAFASVKQIFGVRDFNRDGHNDVMAVQKGTSSLLFFAGDGKGAFAAPVVLRKSWAYPRVTGAGDVTGDGQPDLVVANGDRGLYVIPGASKGTKLGSMTRIGTAQDSVKNVLGWGDLNGDTRPDVLVRAAGTGLATIYAGVAGGKLGQAYGSYTAMGGLSLPSMAPMVSPGEADIVGRDSAGHLVVVPSNGRTNTSKLLPSNLKVTDATQILNVGDWDRNGTGDVIVRTKGGRNLLLYPGLGNGKFGRPRCLCGGWLTVTRLAAVGDVTGDGFPDLIGKIGNGPMTIFPGNGNNAFKAPVLAPASLRTFNQIGSAAWSTKGSALISADGSFVPLSGSTSLGSALRAANGTTDSVYDSYVGVGDANGDGVADVLAREKGTGVLWLLPGKTSGGFAPRTWVANGFASYRLIG